MPQLNTSFRGVAVDIGNSAVHVAQFDTSGHPLPTLSNILTLDSSSVELDTLDGIARQLPLEEARWTIASVHDQTGQQLERWLRQNHPTHQIRSVEVARLPIRVDVEHPDKVGIDRVLATLAARAMGGENSSAIVVDAGTAITVDCLIGGVFSGGAILPGMRMSAAALDRYTEKLPHVSTDALNAPDAIGRDTQSAIESGIFWGAVGAVRELIQRIGECCEFSSPVFITGGDGERLAAHIQGAAYVPNLVLAGIALAATHAESTDD